jgi:hypothetical protein
MPRRERKLLVEEPAVVVLSLGFSPTPQCLPPSSVPMSTTAMRRLSAPPSDGMLGRRVAPFEPGANTVRGCVCLNALGAAEVAFAGESQE